MSFVLDKIVNNLQFYISIFWVKTSSTCTNSNFYTSISINDSNYSYNNTKTQLNL